MSSPRIFRSSASLAVSSSLPSNLIEPEMRALRDRESPMTVSDDTDLPEPDSPTMPSVWPRSTV